MQPQRKIKQKHAQRVNHDMGGFALLFGPGILMHR